MSEPVIQVRGLATRFGANVVHRDLDLTVAAGETLALVGGSGSGKTTLLREIVGLQAYWKGEVRLFGQPLHGTDPAQALALRRRFGLLFQQGALFSALSVFDNIAFPLRELQCLDEALIRDLVALKLAMARFKVPKKVVFGTLPKTSTGKIQKYVLREQAKSAASFE